VRPLSHVKVLLAAYTDADLESFLSMVRPPPGVSCEEVIAERARRRAAAGGKVDVPLTERATDRLWADLVREKLAGVADETVCRMAHGAAPLPVGLTGHDASMEWHRRLAQRPPSTEAAEWDRRIEEERKRRELVDKQAAAERAAVKQAADAGAEAVVFHDGGRKCAGAAVTNAHVPAGVLVQRADMTIDGDLTVRGTVVCQSVRKEGAMTEEGHKTARLLGGLAAGVAALGIAFGALLLSEPAQRKGAAAEPPKPDRVEVRTADGCLLLFECPAGEPGEERLGAVLRRLSETAQQVERTFPAVAGKKLTAAEVK